MIIGSHILIYSRDADADRAFFRDVLQFPHVDVGHGWLIFKLPVAEAGVHPTEDDSGETPAARGMLHATFNLMCDDLKATVASLKAKNVVCTAIDEQPWGSKTTIKMPSGGEIGLYQPKHPTALHLG